MRHASELLYIVIYFGILFLILVFKSFRLVGATQAPNAFNAGCAKKWGLIEIDSKENM